MNLCLVRVNGYHSFLFRSVWLQMNINLTVGLLWTKHLTNDDRRKVMQFLSQESYHLSTKRILKILFCIFPAAITDINIYSGSEMPFVIVLFFCYYVRVLTPTLNPLPKYNVPGGAIQKKKKDYIHTFNIFIVFQAKKKSTSYLRRACSQFLWVGRSFP